MLNYLDIILIVIILVSMIAGFKRGFFSEVVSLVGLVLIIYVAFVFKENLAIIFFKSFPFFNFGGVFEGITVMNILLYEIISFLVIFIVLGILFKIVLLATNIFEKILKFTIIFGIPSKILGLCVGAIEGYIVGFILLMFLNQPTIAMNTIEHSKFAKPILNETPYISSKTKYIVDSATELYSLKDKFKNSSDANLFNKEALDVLLKNKIVEVSSIDILVDNKKLKIKGIEDVLGEYR
jgi:uncharacterized membrane protein required for colicin V production